MMLNPSTNHVPGLRDNRHVANEQSGCPPSAEIVLCGTLCFSFVGGVRKFVGGLTRRVWPVLSSATTPPRRPVRLPQRGAGVTSMEAGVTSMEDGQVGG